MVLSDVVIPQKISGMAGGNVKGILHKNSYARFAKYIITNTKTTITKHRAQSLY